MIPNEVATAEEVIGDPKVEARRVFLAEFSIDLDHGDGFDYIFLFLRNKNAAT